ncbi:hypothetical protein [Aquipuribacter hungaricus]|uniref:Uncharacterized protein n=1 Tax=Aquipuribacter hungaricus TaxID=545624 RepID=A0ABV7WGI1_9MICO
MYLADFTGIAIASREAGGGFEAFRKTSRVVGLGWPADVAEQWLYDHSGNELFLRDYGDVELSRVRWQLEALHAADIATMPTGPSEHDVIDEIAADWDHWIRVRNLGVHLGVAQMWEVHGTWKRWPVLLDRRLLRSSGAGLQVVEGRTRVAILRGRLKQGAFVAEQHLAWVGRPTST